MGLKAMAAAKAGKIFKPVAKAVGKVMTKFDANKPEIMVGGGVVMVLVGTVWMIVKTRQVDNVMAESQEKMAELEEKKAAVTEEGEPAITEKEFRKMVTKVRSETVWAFIKLYGVPALIFVLGIFSLVGGHWVLKKRYILTATSLEGMKKFMEFVKQNVIEDAGEEKWEQYSKGVVGKKEVILNKTEPDGTEITKMSKVNLCKDHENPWRIEFCEDLFDSWKPDTETNFFFLQGCEKYWDEVKYQRNKDAEISMYEVLDYMRIKWNKVDKNYRTWMRNQVWGHHIYGDDKISFGLHMPLNDPARRRLADKIFMEFNVDGEPRDIINRYHDPSYLMNHKPNSKLILGT